MYGPTKYEILNCLWKICMPNLQYWVFKEPLLYYKGVNFWFPLERMGALLENVTNYVSLEMALQRIA